LEFLKKFFDGTSCDIELRTLPTVGRIFTRDETLLDEFIVAHKKSKHHIYFGCCTRKIKGNGAKESCSELISFWVDIDFSKTPREYADKIIADFPFKPSIKIFSGGGYHVYWLLKEPCDAHDPRCEPILKGLMAALQADRSAAEIARILRVPGSMNYKYNPPRKVEILECDWDIRYNVDDFEVFRVEAVEQAASPGTREGKIGPGSRTAAIVSLAGIMNRKGNTLDEAIAACLGLNTRFNPPHTEAYVIEKVKSIYEQYAKQHGPDIAVTSSIETATADSIVPEPLTWLWEHRIPLGKLTVFVGMPDVGKSTVAIDVVSKLTTGRPWPETDVERLPQEVLMLISEDDVSDTVVPRLMAAEANLSKVHFATKTKIISAKTGNQSTRRIALDEDLKALETKLAEHPEIKLVIIDPLGSYLGKLKKNAEEEIRWVLTELKEMAERVKVSIISIDHFNKKTEQTSLQRLSGAGALAAVPRAVWGFMKDTEDAEKLTRLMLNLKLNVVSEANKSGLKYRSVGVDFSIRNVQSSLPKIKWMGVSDKDADEVMQRDTDPEKSKVGKCTLWMRERLNKNEGQEFCSVIYAEAEKQGWNKKVVQRAAARAEVTYDQIGSRHLYKIIPLREPGDE
jgi:RecA-family ATPase